MGIIIIVGVGRGWNGGSVGKGGACSVGRVWAGKQRHPQRGQAALVMCGGQRNANKPG